MSTAVGQAALRERLRLRVPPPAVESYLVAGARRTEIRDSHVVESFPQRYAPGESAVSHLRFALRYEPIDLGVFAAALKVIDPAEIAEWVRREPTGGFARRTWFLNLLGDAGLCSTVRRTGRLETWMAARLGDDARALTAGYDPAVPARAVNYLYTKETRSSFAIEGETPSPSRTERFVAALRSAADFDPADHAVIVRLQGSIVDPRYAAAGWRDFQNWVGGVAAGYREAVDFIPPRPEDVPGLMEAWTRLTCGLDADDLVDPVVAAAVSAFAFVFEWRFTPERRLIVENDTADLYTVLRCDAAGRVSVRSRAGGGQGDRRHAGPPGLALHPALHGQRWSARREPARRVRRAGRRRDRPARGGRPGRHIGQREVT